MSLRITKRGLVLLTTTCLAAAAALGGAAGASLALWHDRATMAGQIRTGGAAFAVGKPSGSLTQAGSDHRATFTFGPAEAATLLSAGAVAVPILVDSVSQGNRGLRYTVTPPTYPTNSIFGSSAPTLFKVGSAAACTTAAVPPAPNPLTSTPVSAAYSTSTTPTTEYWCVVARLGTLPDEGTYTNHATVTGQSEFGPAQDNTQWSAKVTTAMTAAAEPTHTVTFTYSTFRPGA